MRSWRIVPVIVIIGLLLISCGGTKPAPPAKPTTPPAINASKIYAEKCVACHGANRQGVAGLGTTLTPQSLAGRSDTEITNTITNGRPNTAMIAWQGILSPAEIEAMLKFVKYTPP